MAKVTITIEDDPALAADGRPHVNIHMESSPAFALRDRKPDVDAWTSAQCAAYFAIEEVIGSSAATELIVVDVGEHQPQDASR